MQFSVATCLAEADPEMLHLYPEIAFNAVDEAFRLQGDLPLAIQLSGGETFVNFGLFKDVIAYIGHKRKETGRRVAIVTQTNGTAVTDEIATFAKDHDIEIGVSIDGPEWLNNISRRLLGGGNSHQRTLRGIESMFGMASRSERSLSSIVPMWPILRSWLTSSLAWASKAPKSIQSACPSADCCSTGPHRLDSWRISHERPTDDKSQGFHDPSQSDRLD
jgi:hypothetical protein